MVSAATVASKEAVYARLRFVLLCHRDYQLVLCSCGSSTKRCSAIFSIRSCGGAGRMRGIYRASAHRAHGGGAAGGADRASAQDLARQWDELNKKWSAGAQKKDKSKSDVQEGRAAPYDARSLPGKEWQDLEKWFGKTASKKLSGLCVDSAKATYVLAVGIVSGVRTFQRVTRIALVNIPTTPVNLRRTVLGQMLERLLLTEPQVMNSPALELPTVFPATLASTSIAQTAKPWERVEHGLRFMSTTTVTPEAASLNPRSLRCSNI